MAVVHTISKAVLVFLMLTITPFLVSGDCAAPLSFSETVSANSVIIARLQSTGSEQTHSCPIQVSDLKNLGYGPEDTFSTYTVVQVYKNSIPYEVISAVWDTDTGTRTELPSGLGNDFLAFLFPRTTCSGGGVLSPTIYSLSECIIHHKAWSSVSLGELALLESLSAPAPSPIAAPPSTCVGRLFLCNK